MKSTLNNVTICAIDCLQPELAIRAIEKSLLECDFKEAIILTNSDINLSTIRLIKIPNLNSKDSYSKFILKDLYKHIDTDYVLIVQWDGYVIDGTQWKRQYLDYDYMGAKWEWHKDGMNIGNGGFSIRSKNLLQILARDDFPFIPKMNEDDQICRYYRKKLEQNYFIKFPSEELADQFSYERSLPNYPTFGFHGLFNLWRYIDDQEMINITRQFHTTIYHSIEFSELMIHYFTMRKFKIVNALYKLIKFHCTQDEIYKNLILITDDKNFVKWFIMNQNKLSHDL